MTRLHVTLDLNLVGAPVDLAAAARVIVERLEIEARYAADDNNAGVAAVACAFSVAPTDAVPA